MSSGTKLRESTLVRPAAQTPGGTLWLSNMDLVMPRQHVPYIYFYRPTTPSPSFFDPSLLRRALSDALVLFYPIAGRLKRGVDGCLTIDCNGEGALFIEADSGSAIDDFGDFAPTSQLSNLGPKVDYRDGISSYPLLLTQVTYFRCGGVSLMLLLHHTVADGTAAFHFINTWSELARGLANPSILPSIDHTPLQAKHPPSHLFNHHEYQRPPALNTPPPPQTNTSTAVSIFNISTHQLHLLKSQTIQEPHGIACTTFETLAAHIWRCVCKARNLPEHQETKLYIPVNGRKRLQPALAQGYFGNALFTATPVAAAGELIRPSSLAHAAGIIHTALRSMDSQYLRSAVDYLEQVRSNIETAVIFGGDTFRSPNLRITSWLRMPIHDADFGWGRPMFTGTGTIPVEGMCIVIPQPGESGSDDGGDIGGFSLAISLQSDHMNRFHKLLYEF